MNVEKLLFDLDAISTILKTSILQTASKSEADVDHMVKRFIELVEEMKLQRHNLSFQDETSKQRLDELSNLLESLTRECDVNLKILDFVNQIKPIS